MCNNNNQQEEGERDQLQRQESQLSREKSRLSTELMALQAKKNDATDPTEELERELEVATEVCRYMYPKYTCSEPTT